MAWEPKPQTPPITSDPDSSSESRPSSDTFGNDRTRELALVARLRSDDPVAFTVLMEQYANLLTKFAFYIVGSRDTADDVVQQVFIQLWEHRAGLDPMCQLKPYLYRAIRNRSFNVQDSNQVRDRYIKSTQSELTSGNLSAFVPSPEGIILTQADVQAAIERLSDRRRLAVRLRIEEEMTHAEIAEILEVTPETAQRLVARAIADLREILEGGV